MYTHKRIDELGSFVLAESLAPNRYKPQLMTQGDFSYITLSFIKKHIVQYHTRLPTLADMLMYGYYPTSIT